MELRPYQKKAVLAALKETENTIISATTGSGKSLLISELAKKTPGNVLIFQPTKEILEQNVEHYKNLVDDNYKILSASMNSFEVGKITFSTIGTAKNRTELFDKKISLVIIDECHRFNTKNTSMYGKFFKDIGYKDRVIGLTATPYRIVEDKWDQKHKMTRGSLDVLTELGKENKKPPFWKSICYDADIERLISMGYLIKPEYKIYSNKERYKMLKENISGGWSKKSLEDWDRDNEILVTQVCKEAYSEKNKIICFVDTIAVAESISLSLKQEGLNAEYISSTRSSKEVSSIIQKFRETKSKMILINVNQLTEGFDVKPCDAVVLGTPTKSLGRYIQRVGRCVRLWEGKKPVVYDVARSSERFGKVENIHIAKKKTGEYIVINKDPETRKIKIVSGWMCSVEEEILKQKNIMEWARKRRKVSKPGRVSKKKSCSKSSKFSYLGKPTNESVFSSLGTGYTKEQKWNDGKGKVPIGSPEMKALWEKFERNLKKMGK